MFAQAMVNVLSMNFANFQKGYVMLPVNAYRQEVENAPTSTLLFAAEMMSYMEMIGKEGMLEFH